VLNAIAISLVMLTLLGCGQNPAAGGASGGDAVIEDPNQAPTIAVDPTFTYLSGSDDAIGQVVTNDTDGDVLSISLEAEDARQFEIDAEGTLRFVATPRFVAPEDANQDNRYQLTIVASDGKASVSADLVVEVLDAIVGIVAGPLGPAAKVTYDQDYTGVARESLTPITADAFGGFIAQRLIVPKNQKQVAYAINQSATAETTTIPVTLITRVPADPNIEAIRLSPMSTLLYSLRNPSLKDLFIHQFGLRQRKGSELGDPYWEEFAVEAVSEDKLAVWNEQIGILMSVGLALVDPEMVVLRQLVRSQAL